MPTILLDPNWDRKLLKQLVSVSDSDKCNRILCEVQAGQRVLNLTTILAPIQMRVQIRLRACDSADDFDFVLPAPQFFKAITRLRKIKDRGLIRMKIDPGVVEVDSDDAASTAQLCLPLEVADTTAPAASHRLELLCPDTPPELFREQPSEPQPEVQQWLVPPSWLAKNLWRITHFTAQTEHDKFDYQIQIQGQRLRVVVEGNTVTSFATLNSVADAESPGLPAVAFALNRQQIAQLRRFLPRGQKSSLTLQYQRKPARLHVLDDRQARLSMDIKPNSIRLSRYEHLMTRLDAHKLSPLNASQLLEHVQLISVAKHEQKQRIEFLFERPQTSAAMPNGWDLTIRSQSDAFKGRRPLLMGHNFPENTQFGINSAALQHALEALIPFREQAQWCVLDGKRLVLFADDMLGFELACQSCRAPDEDGW